MILTKLPDLLHIGIINSQSKSLKMLVVLAWTTILGSCEIYAHAQLPWHVKTCDNWITRIKVRANGIHKCSIISSWIFCQMGHRHSLQGCCFLAVDDQTAQMAVVIETGSPCLRFTWCVMSLYVVPDNKKSSRVCETTGAPSTKMH